MDAPKKGDIIRFRRGTVYSHYGIYIGDGKVIHMTVNQEGGSLNSIKSTKATIKIDQIKDVEDESEKAEIANYLDGQSEPLSPEEIVKRATKKLGEGDYNVVTNNCEHFVTWCRYGEATSKQVEDFKKFAADVVSPVTFLIKQLLETLPKTSPTPFQ